MPSPTLAIPGAFEPEAIAAMTEALDAACEKLGKTDQPEVTRELIAGRIIAAARFGERDTARLLEAALHGSDYPRPPRRHPAIELQAGRSAN